MEVKDHFTLVKQKSYFLKTKIRLLEILCRKTQHFWESRKGLDLGSAKVSINLNR